MNDDTFVPRSRSAARTAVLGVVVPIPEPWSQLFVDWRAKVGDPQANSVPPHVTLLPPTEVPVAHRPAITEHLAEVARTHPPFDMHLSGTGTFAPVSAVVFVAVARGIGNCELIANDVRRGPLARSLSYPYHPHVTVATTCRGTCWTWPTAAWPTSRRSSGWSTSPSSSRLPTAPG